MNAPIFARALIVLGLMLWSFATFPTAQTGTREAFPGVANGFWRIDHTAATGGGFTDRAVAIPELKRRGFRSVINVAGGKEAEIEGKEVEAAGMKYFLIPIDPKTLDPAPIEPFLAVVKDTANQPYFIHSGGGHRAAALWLIKRVVVDGWSMERAGTEAASSGLINDNPMVPRLLQWAQDYFRAHPPQPVSQLKFFPK